MINFHGILEFDSIQKGLSQQTIPPRIPRNLKLVVKLPGIIPQEKTASVSVSNLNL